jgi:hypothetical protein
MSGLEIAAGIAGIISAIVTVSKAVKENRRRRKAKKLSIFARAQNAEAQLLTTLDDGPPRINTEYNRDLARIGPEFNRGDGSSSHLCLTYR